MLHHVARAVPGRLLFTSWREGVALWQRLLPAVTGLDALVLMPDHLHLLHPHDVRPALAQALAGHVRARNHRLGLSGAGVRRLDAPTRIPAGAKARRMVRYVALNPCRAGLVTDPLAWPLSTYRDQLGLALAPILPAARDPWDLHAFVSSDPSVLVHGTSLPTKQARPLTPDEVAEAVCALARASRADLTRRGPLRDTYLACAIERCIARKAEIAAIAGVRRQQLYRAPPAEATTLHRVSWVAGDPRFRAFVESDLRALSAWGRYRSRV